MPERLAGEGRVRDELGERVVGALEREAGERREGLELRERAEPSERRLAGALPPRVERERAPEIPHERGADEELEDLVVTRVEEADDPRQGGHLLGRRGAALPELPLQRLERRRLELLVLEERQHPAVPR